MPVAEGRFLSEMLLAGDLEAIYSPPRPARYDPAAGPIVRLFPDCREVECDYFKATGVYPPQHLIVIRREVWERDKWLARSLTDAFIQSNAIFAAAQRNFPYVSPWLDCELEETEALMGADFHRTGSNATAARSRRSASRPSTSASPSGGSRPRSISPNFSPPDRKNQTHGAAVYGCRRPTAELRGRRSGRQPMTPLPSSSKRRAGTTAAIW